MLQCATQLRAVPPCWQRHVNPAFWQEEKQTVNDQVQPRPHLLGVISRQEVRACALFLSRVRWELNWLSGSPPADWPRLERHPCPLLSGGRLFKELHGTLQCLNPTIDCLPTVSQSRFYANAGSAKISQRKNIPVSNTCMFKRTTNCVSFVCHFLFRWYPHIWNCGFQMCGYQRYIYAFSTWVIQSMELLTKLAIAITKYFWHLVTNTNTSTAFQD